MKKIIVLFLLMCSLGYSQNENKAKNEFTFNMAVANYVIGITFNDSMNLLMANSLFNILKKEIKGNDISKSIDFEKLRINETEFKDWTTLDKWTKACEKALKENVSKKYIPVHRELCLGDSQRDRAIYSSLVVIESKLLPAIIEMNKNKKMYEIELKELKEMLIANRIQQKIFLQHMLTEHEMVLNISDLVYTCQAYKAFEKMIELNILDELDVRKYMKPLI